VERSTLKECGEEKEKGALHPKSKSERRKVTSLPQVFSSFFGLEKKKMPSPSSFTLFFLTYLPLLSFSMLLL
jgi:hypothetical protein